VSLAELEGRVRPDRMVLRLRRLRAAGTARAVAGLHAETAEYRRHPSRGGPAGGEPRQVAPRTQPLLLRGMAPSASIQAAVSDAQRRLNAFLAQHQTGVLACRSWARRHSPTCEIASVGSRTRASYRSMSTGTSVLTPSLPHEPSRPAWESNETAGLDRSPSRCCRPNHGHPAASARAQPRCALRDARLPSAQAADWETREMSSMDVTSSLEEESWSLA
jgi:hypothetical protein